MTKEERIQAECDRLADIYATLPEPERKMAEHLIQNSAFMVVTLQDLQEIINENGTVDTYQNGNNQSGTKSSAELNAYNTTLKSYLNTQKQLVAMLPKLEKKKGLVSEFAEMLK